MENFADEVAALRPMLVRMARQRLRNDAWAEDAVSETIVAALENAAAYGGRAKAQTWMVGILKHKVVDQIRRHTRECQLGNDEDADFDDLADDEASAAIEARADWADPQEHVSRRQFMADFDRCLQALPQQQGRAFVLRNWIGKETDEICSELGVSAGNLSVLLHRARGRLREALQSRWTSGSGMLRPQLH